MILFFYLASCEDWTTFVDSTWWCFKAFNSPFCISGAVMGFLSQKDFKTKESKDLLLKSLIPFILQTSLSPSFLLHNLMSQETTKEITRNKKKKVNWTGKTGRELSNDKLNTINLYPFSEWRHHWRTPFSFIKNKGAGRRPPPPLYPE